MFRRKRGECGLQIKVRRDQVSEGNKERNRN